MKKKRVLHILEGKKAGEMETQVLNLLKVMDDEKYESEILCLSAGELAGLAEVQGIGAGTVEARHMLDRSAIVPVQEFIKSRKIKLVHSHDMRASTIGRIAAGKENLPVVSTVHKSLTANSGSVFETALLKYLSKITAKYSDRFIASTAFIEKELQGMRIPAEKIRLVYDGLDSNMLLPLCQSEKSREKLGLDVDKLTVTMTTGASTEAGYECFLRAARMVVDTGIKTQFIIYGEVQSRGRFSRSPAVKQWVEELKLQQMCSIIPRKCPWEEIYAASNLICIPSINGQIEQFILGAMFQGVPLIAFENSELAEIIEDRSTGLLVKAADYKDLGYAIMKILIDKDLREIIQAHAQERVEDFTLEKTACQVEEIYDELLKAH